MDSVSPISLSDIEKAKENFQGFIPVTPTIYSSYFSRLTGAEVFLKLENLQETGSFKIRGAYNRLLYLTPEQKQRGVIAASAGNHAQGLAMACRKLGISATIVMPEDVSIRKLLAVKEFDPEIILHGSEFSQAYDHSEELSRQTGKILIPPFDDPHVIAGQGTIGLEILPELKEQTAIVVPVGGGGLISGIASAVKPLRPDVRLIGVQAASCPSVPQSLAGNEPVDVPVQSTLADGIAVSRPGKLTFPIIKKYVDDVVLVKEEDIAGAILTLLDKANLIAEGSGAVPLAALMNGKAQPSCKRYILIISGGNIEINRINRILQRGAVKMGQVVRLEVNIRDIPGSLYSLLNILAEEKANILHILHDRLDIKNPIDVSRVMLNLETQGHQHARDIMHKLQSAGYEVKKVL